MRATVAEDEPLLADALVRALGACWPELEVGEPLGDGDAAIARLLDDRPDVAFLDVRMPGADGLEVARTVLDEWPEDAATAPPAFVFVTAHAEFAVRAFDCAAIDYLVKPIVPERLAETVSRVRERLRSRPPTAPARAGTTGVDALEGVATALGPGRGRLSRVCASVGGRIRVVPIEDVLLFEAGDKYVDVHARQGVMQIRRSLRELLPALDPATFRQVHRRAIVNLGAVSSATRVGNGTLVLELDGTDHRVPVSRAFAHLFRAM